MKEVIRYRWRKLWLGKWITTSYHATEEEMKSLNPEAVPVEGTREVLLVPSTIDEAARQSRAISAGGLYRGFDDKG